MPTDAEMAAYAQQLPQIYRDILAAFPEVEPGRKAGFGLAFQTLTAHFYNRKIGHALDEVREACRQLAAAGLVEIHNEIFAHPTELGERLIAILTGKRAPVMRVPDLPRPTW
jgi:hypothetical protein